MTCGGPLSSTIELPASTANEHDESKIVLPVNIARDHDRGCSANKGALSENVNGPLGPKQDNHDRPSG